jgi:septal ring factor EnvC (AmiA/AmiB activator)
MKDMEKEKAIFRTVHSELEQSLKTSTTEHASLQAQHASLQADHTEVQKAMVHVKDQYKKCMDTNLELQEKLYKAQVHKSDGVSQRCSWCVTTTIVEQQYVMCVSLCDRTSSSQSNPKKSRGWSPQAKNPNETSLDPVLHIVLQRR